MAKKAVATIREKITKKKSQEKSAADDPEIVTGSRLAAVLADPPFSDRWLRQLADDGYLVKPPRGKHDLAASFRGYIRPVRETEVKAAQDAAN